VSGLEKHEAQVGSQVNQVKPSSNGEGSKEGFFETLLEKYLKEKKEEKESKKVQQIIWLELPTFARILNLTAKHKVAPNVICSAIIEHFFDTLDERQRTVERVKIVCPECGIEVKDLLEHLKQNPREARSLAHRLLTLSRWAQ
jgi:hypothetical protein